MGETAVTVSILVALSGWAIALVTEEKTARLAWTLGTTAYLIHVVAAFETFYGWSHGTALAETARQTAEVTGINTGAGLWVNHAFTAVLAFDVFQQWTGKTRRFATAIDWLVIFMIVNGAVVFADGAVRGFGIVLTLAILVLRLGGRRVKALENSAGSSSLKS